MSRHEQLCDRKKETGLEEIDWLCLIRSKQSRRYAMCMMMIMAEFNFYRVSNYVQVSSMSRLVQLLAVKLSTAVSESGSRLLRGNVALRLCHHLVTNQELSHGRAAEEGRVEVHVEVTGLNLLGSTFKWCLVKTHAYCLLVSSISQIMDLDIL
jgi:hypothetical protein